MGAMFEHFENFCLGTNYLEEIATDPQVSIQCIERANYTPPTSDVPPDDGNISCHTIFYNE